MTYQDSGSIVTSTLPPWAKHDNVDAEREGSLYWPQAWNLNRTPKVQQNHHQVGLEQPTSALRVERITPKVLRQVFQGLSWVLNKTLCQLVTIMSGYHRGAVHQCFKVWSMWLQIITNLTRLDWKKTRPSVMVFLFLNFKNWKKPVKLDRFIPKQTQPQIPLHFILNLQKKINQINQKLSEIPSKQ